LLNEVGLSLFRYFEVGLRVCDIVVNKFTFAISSPDEFLLRYASGQTNAYRNADHNTLHLYRGQSNIHSVHSIRELPALRTLSLLVRQRPYRSHILLRLGIVFALML